MARTLGKLVRVAKGQLGGTRRFRRYVGKKRFFTTLRTPKPKPHKLKKAVAQSRGRQQEIRAGQKAQRHASLQAKVQTFQKKQIARRVSSPGAQRFKSRAGKASSYISRRPKAPTPSKGMSRRRRAVYGVLGAGAVGGAVGGF